MTLQTLPRLDLDLVARNINKLPSPSAVIAELLACIDDDEMSSATLAKIIAKDQALVARLLRIANSSFYGMSGRVESVSGAITVLGFRTVRTLSAASALSGDLTALSAPGFDFGIFWRHGIATALLARALAHRMKLGEGAAFVAGLLHDVGRLMLACSFRDHLAAAASYQATHACFMHEAELAAIGIDHARIGGFLCERWHFPPTICDGIAHHHRTYDPESGLLACVVHLADAMAHALDLAGDPAEVVPCISQYCWNRTNLSWRDSQEIFAEVEQEFAPLSQVLLS